MDKKHFFDECERIFSLNRCVPLPEAETLEKLFSLSEIMLEVNEKMNLTAITDTSGMILKHYLDSLTVSEYIPSGANIIDVGCGAGFPSLPLAIARPDIRITALDSTAKRINYVNGTAKELGLPNLLGITARAEELANDKEYRERYDVATARAVADLQILAELCLPFVKVGGVFAAMKAAKGEEELARSKNAIKTCGGAPAELVSLELTANGSDFEKRSIILSKKVAPTPNNYPRNFGRIQKKPL